MVICREWNYVWTGFLSHNSPIPSLYISLLMFCTLQTPPPCILHCLWYIMLSALLPTGLLCAVRCSVGLFSSLCDKSFNIGCSVCPRRNRLRLTFYCNIKKGLILYLSFAEHQQAHNTIILGKVCT